MIFAGYYAAALKDEINRKPIAPVQMHRGGRIFIDGLQCDAHLMAELTRKYLHDCDRISLHNDKEYGE